MRFWLCSTKASEDGTTTQISSERLGKSGIEPATPGPEVIKLFPCSTQLSTKLILLINVKMPTITIVGILTFISMIDTTSERLIVRHLNVDIFCFNKQLKFHAQLS